MDYPLAKEMPECCASTPREELERQIMDANLPKNEREWWAAHEIERLRAALHHIIEVDHHNHGPESMATKIAREALHQQSEEEIEREMVRDGTTKDESYLGDGLYATFDGWQMILRAPRDGGDHHVALEPETFKALIRFADHINAKYKVKHFKPPA